MCIHDGCNIGKIYNYEGETKGLYCSKHKLEGMIDVKNKKCVFMKDVRLDHFLIKKVRQKHYIVPPIN